MAHTKGQGSTRNGRDSRSKRLGVKCFDGQRVHAGAILVRQRGSHRQYRHPDGRGKTAPFHGGRDIAPALLRKIARDIGLSVEALLDRARGGPARPTVRGMSAFRTSWVPLE